MAGGHTGQRLHRLPGDDRQAGRQLSARLIESPFEPFAAPGEQQQFLAEPLGMLHDVSREDHRGAARGGAPDFILEETLVDRVSHLPV